LGSTNLSPSGKVATNSLRRTSRWFLKLSERRSENMRAVRGKDTQPEITVRRAAHGLGLRFRLFRGDLPGRPDLTFSKWRTVLFVNGCFWHQHPNCERAKLPKTNRSFWAKKLERNAARDMTNYAALRAQGWRVLVLWECEIRRFDVRQALRGWFPRRADGRFKRKS
jgi:DNA mismatch endonuclease (patch repair protein)